MDIVAIISIALATGSLVAAAIVVPATRRASRPVRSAEAKAIFSTDRQEFNTNQVKLAQRALDTAPANWRYTEAPMLQLDGWIFDTPQPLTAIRPTLDTSSQDVSPLIAGARIFKTMSTAKPYTFIEAIAETSEQFWYTNGIIYRPIAVTRRADSLAITFTIGRYFDHICTSELLGFEYSRGDRSRYRKKVGDPFDLTNRVASLGILTLTIVKHDNGSATFLMHKRTSNIILGSDLFHVVPAGEFTPSDISLGAIRSDFNIARNISREYAEELLGHSDAQGQGGLRIDYDSASPYREMRDSIADGALRVFTFGIGLDPLTWKPELLTVAVFDEAAFQSAFPGVMTGNYEGKIIVDIPMTAENIQEYLDSGDTRLGAKACLSLAWKHRAVLGVSHH